MKINKIQDLINRGYIKMQVSDMDPKDIQRINDECLKIFNNLKNLTDRDRTQIKANFIQEFNHLPYSSRTLQIFVATNLVIQRIELENFPSVSIDPFAKSSVIDKKSFYYQPRNAHERSYLKPFIENLQIKQISAKIERELFPSPYVDVRQWLSFFIEKCQPALFLALEEIITNKEENNKDLGRSLSKKDMENAYIAITCLVSDRKFSLFMQKAFEAIEDKQATFPQLYNLLEPSHLAFLEIDNSTH